MLDIKSIDALFTARRNGYTLPQALYTHDDAFDFDMKAIFAQSWLSVGFDCELPKSGSYLSLMIGKWPVIIVRDKSGNIRAFHNSCRHRGSMICALGSGTSPKLVCPYHRWTYDLNGALFNANQMADDFDKSDHGLKPIALEIVAGAMFICLSDDPPPFAEFGEKLSQYAAPHHYKDAKVAFQSVLVEHANWKLVMENARECYHCGTGHPELAKTFPVDMSNHFDLADDEAAQQFAAAMKANGLATDPLEGDWWQVARFALNKDCVSITMDGKHASQKLMCDANSGDIGSMRWAIDPHCFVHSTADHVFWFSAMPVSATETHVTGKWLVHKDAVEGVDYDVNALSDLWTRTNCQDKELAENNHMGVNSLGYAPGPYSPDSEMLSRRFTDWYCDQSRVYIDTYVD